MAMNKYLGEPCRNFCFMAACSLRARDGRLKLVLGSWAGCSTGALIFVDLETFESETVMLPGDNGAEFLLNLNDEKLLVGTSAEKGYLHSLDLKTMQWAEPLRIDSETYIWHMSPGPDGYVYCGTYNGCLLLRYDPRAHKLESLGRASANPKNMYSRYVQAGAPGKVFVKCGFDTSETILYDIEAGSFSPVFEPGSLVTHANPEYVRVVRDGEVHFYDAKTLEPVEREDIGDDRDPRLDASMNPVVTAADGTVCGARGQMVFRMRKDEPGPLLRQLDAEPLPTEILSLEAGPDGKIWGSTTLGQTIFNIDPATGNYWDSLNVSDDNGEVYGMRFAGGKLFMTAYAAAEHIVYDPREPWNQLGNVNPRTFFRGRPKLVRPVTKSVVGPDGRIWTGWMVTYGTYGSGISRIDPDTLETKVWYDLVGLQSPRSIAAGEKYIYMSTYGSANGLPARSDEYVVAAFATDDCREIARRTYPRNISAGGLVWCAGRLLACKRDELEILDGDTLVPVHVIPIEGYASAPFRYDDRHIGLFLGTKFVLLDPAEGRFAFECEASEKPNIAIRGKDGAVYYAIKSKLYSLSIQNQE